MNHFFRHRFVFCLLFILPFFSVAQTLTDSLETLFRNPPTSAKPFVWWHWMGPNFSKEGITKDLEAMKAEGIGGATIFNLSSAVQESHYPTLNNPWPEQTYRSAAYWEALRFAAAEADRLGLEIGLHNTVGYSTTGGPWIAEERSMQHLVWSDTLVNGGSQLNIKLRAPVLIADEGWGKTGRTISYYKDVVVLAMPAQKNIIVKDEVLTLTSNYDEVNGLQWNAPAGKWKLYRICHAPTGRPPHPVPDDLLGKVLEVDKMSAEQSNWHWNNVIDPVKEHLGDYIGKSFRHMLIDSYEAGDQNWTANFHDEFIKRKGYDPIPWLASLSMVADTGNTRRTIESIEQTARFDWDYRDVISQLFFDNGWKIGKQKLAAANLNLQMEPYEGPFNTAQGVGLADIPMAEFWTAGTAGITPEVPAAARAAGKNIVGAEAFTGRPELSQFTEDPAFLKITGDQVFTQGINRLVLHHWVHQPFDDAYQPGMGMGWWGTHFGRNQTWFEPAKAYFAYLARCQALLQFGQQPADYLSIGKADSSADLLSIPDFLAQDIQIKNKQVLLPSGRSYAFIIFPEAEKMLPEVIQKIKQLVNDGAVLVASKPGSSPSLQNFPQCDSAVKKIALEVWGNGTSHAYGKGFAFSRKEDAITATGIAPAFQIEHCNNPAAIKIVQRQSADTALYFVANLSEQAQQLTVSFRSTGKQPELWQAEDGSVMDAPVWNEKDGRTTVQLQLNASQSIFVVFRKNISNTDHPIAIKANDSTVYFTTTMVTNGKAVLITPNAIHATIEYASGKQKTLHTNATAPITINGAWKVTFAPKLEKLFQLNFPRLIDFSLHSNKSVKYFAGTATYQKQVTVTATALSKNKRVVLDLGVMNDIAEVKVNGKSAGILWYPPFTCDISSLLKPGANKLEIAVTNNWANRLIGDEQEPADFEWGKDRGEQMGRAMLAYPDWFIKKQPRPSQGRKTFSIWSYYRRDSPLKPAGLVGPVRLITETISPID